MIPLCVTLYDPMKRGLKAVYFGVTETVSRYK